MGAKSDKSFFHNKGLTLVELIVVMAVLAVLLGGGILAGIGWYHHMIFLKENEYARSLYTVAQNQLTEYAANGRIDLFKEQFSELPSGSDPAVILLASNTAEKLSKEICPDGTDMATPESVWANVEAASKTTSQTVDKAKYRGSLVSVLLTADDYAKYQSGTLQSGSLEDSQKTAIYDLFTTYLYDRSLLKASICVEFSPEAGQVFSVLYSDRKAAGGKFIYEGKNGRSGLNISVRSSSFRDSRLIGYYGVDTLSKDISAKKEKPSITDLSLNNAETLNLTFRINKIPQAIGELTYDIKVYSKTLKGKDGKDQLLFTIRLNEGWTGTDPSTKVCQKGTGGNENKVSCTILKQGIEKFEYEDKDCNKVKDALAKKFDVIAYYSDALPNEQTTMTVILDAADLAASTNQYFKSDISTTGEDNYLRDTMSFHRFEEAYSALESFDTGEIYCVVSGSLDGYYQNTTPRTSNAENPYFANETGDSEAGSTVSRTVGLKNARHLYNIRYIEDYYTENISEKVTHGSLSTIYNKTYITGTGESESGSEVAVDPSGGNSTKSLDLKVGKSFSWTEFKTGGYLYLSQTPVKDFAASGTSSAQTYDFPSIKLLRSTDTFEGNVKSGSQKYAISGISVSASANNGYIGDAVSGRNKENMKNPDTVIFTGEEIKLSNSTTKTNDPTVASYARWAVNSSISNYSAGLFLTNYGTIRNLTLDKITVTGQKNVGSFCAVDSGKDLSGLTVGHSLISSGSTAGTGDADGSTVSGRRNVGGIAGTYIFSKGNTKKSTSYDSLVNYATVKEAGVNGWTVSGPAAKDSDNAWNLGGIVGYLDFVQKTADETELSGSNNYGKSITVTDCLNYGPLEALAHEGYKKDSKDLTIAQTENLGGIIGKCTATATAETQTNGAVTVTTSTVTVNSCKAAPQYTSGGNSVIWTQSDVKAKLNGWYVGGIIGYNDGGLVEKCNTTRENTKAEGYIFGDRYVGGIIGYNVGADAVLSGLDDNQKITDNQGHVMGNDFVGGVVGYNPSGTIMGWRNTGFVGAVTSYAGGVAGANGYVDSAKKQDGSPVFNNSEVITAKLVKGTSNVGSGTAITTLSNLKTTDSTGKTVSLFNADYVGGITGYNDGLVAYNYLDSNNGGNRYDLDSISSLVANVTGGNFVGGIVGYNDIHSVISGYAVGGGSISGKKYVGGFAGFNASVNLLEYVEGDTDKNNKLIYDSDKPDSVGRDLKSNPNSIKGDYYVGGTIGGNIIPVEKDIAAHFSTDNFLGKLTATEYGGGFIGYNRLIGTVSSLPDATMKASLRKDVQASLSLSDTVPVLSDVSLQYGNKDVHTTKTITINGKTASQSGAGSTSGTKLSVLSAKYFIGGVIGCNDEETYLIVKNVTNMSEVAATSYLTSVQEVTKHKSDTNPFRYSYVGGIIGKVTKYAVIDGCGNAQQGRVTTNGTYTGGICEINEGLIINCTVSSTGSNAASYVGGIAGANLPVSKSASASGNSSASGSSASGSSGSSTGSSSTADTQVTYGGKDYTSGTIADCKFGNVTVTGKDCVGGIAAENYGVISGTIVGQSSGSSGAAAGSSSSADNAVVNATGENVGGLIGYNYSGATVNCADSSGNPIVMCVTVSGNKNVGGVAGISEDVLSGGQADAAAGASAETTAGGGMGGKYLQMGSTSNITASGSVAGGFFGVYKGTAPLQYLQNAAAVSASDGYAGGIAGQNTEKDGMIQFCNNTGDVTAVSSGYAAGIVSDNSGKIAHCSNKADVASAGGSAGGIAATSNTGASITYCNSEGTSKNKITITALNDVGGIAAANSGNIDNSNVSYLKVVNNSKSRETSNVGGIAGSNEAAISDTTVSDCTIQTYPSASNLGGVAGINNDGGTIEMPVPEDKQINTHTITYSDDAYNITTSVWDGTGTDKKIVSENNSPYVDCVTDTGLSPHDTASYANGNIGGVAGTNEGSIQNVAVSADITGTSGGTAYGYGGIAGINNKTISYCSYQARTDSNDTTVSGISVAGTNVNLGGIAGINGNASNTSAEIKYCVIGISKATTISNSLSGSASGNVGGIAGLHYGSILNCDNYKYSSAKVTISNDAGNVAGIAGTVSSAAAKATGEDINNRLYRLSTGAAWTVTSKASYNDNGIGGILGFSVSGEDINYADNHAKIFITYTGKAALGGLIGRSQIDSIGMSVSNCVNYGDIKNQGGWDSQSDQLAGGMIGREKYQCVNFENCQNYGDIQAGRAGGGLLGWGYQSIGSYYVMDCYNFGNITGKEASGLVGLYTKGTVSSISIIRSINVGVIDSKNGTSYGLAKGTDKDNGVNALYLYRCRNYGYSSNSKFYGLCNGADIISDCFNLSNKHDFSINNSLFRSYNVISGSTAAYSYEAIVINKGNNNYTIQMGNNNSSNLDDFTLSKAPLQMINDSHFTDNKINGGTVGNRQTAFDTIDPMVVKYYVKLSGANKPSAPTITKLVQTSNQINLTWAEPSGGAYGYELHYNVKKKDGTFFVNDEKVQLSYGMKNYILTIDPTWKGATVCVTLYAYNIDSDSNIVKSDAAEQNITLKDILAAPKVHLELLPDTDYYCYVLENPEDYEDEYRNPIKNVKISVTGISKEYTITPESSNYSVAFKVDSSNQPVVSIYAYDSSKSYANSSTTKIQTYVIKNEAVKYCNGGFSKYLINKFSGTLTDNLQAKIETKAATPADFYLMSDVYINEYQYQALNKTYKIDTSISYDVSHTNISEMAYSTLSNFPSDILFYTKFFIRSYYWRSQNDFSWYGYLVKTSDGSTSFSKTKLIEYLNATNDGTVLSELTDSNYKQLNKDNTVTLDKQHAIFYKKDDSIKIDSNYNLRLNADGTYSVLFIPAASSTGHSREYDVKTTVDGGTISYDQTTTNQIQPKPTIDSGVSIANGNEYTFTWDKDKGYSRAIYELKLYGIEDDGNLTLLDEVDETEVDSNGKGATSHTFSDSKNVWNYAKMRLYVTRYGTENSETGYTDLFPRTNCQDFNVKKRLSQISQPTLTLQDKNNLIYNVTWAAVPSEERSAVAKYEITVKDVTQAEGHQTVAKKTVTYPSDDSSTLDSTADSLTAAVDLSAFNGCTVSVSVKAIAKENDNIYRTGIDGVPRELALTTRLSVPAADKLTGNPVWKSSKFMTIDTLKDTGITLNMTSASDEAKSDPQAYYELAVDVMDSQTVTEPLQTLIYKQGEQYTDSDGNKQTADATSMSGDLTNGTYTLNSVTQQIDPKYAGKWLRVALRAVSASNISSYWTDANPDTEAAQAKYAWIQIPRVQLARPEVTKNTVLDPNVQFSDENSADLTRQVLDFNTVTNADDYVLTVIQNGILKHLDGKNYTVSYVHWIYLDKTDAGYDVYYATSNPDANITVEVDTADTDKDGDQYLVNAMHMYKLGTLPSGESTLDLNGYTVSIPANDNPTVTTQTTASLTFTTESGGSGTEGTFRLKLPDVEKIGDKDVKSSTYPTSQVTVQALTDTTNLFEASRITNYSYANGVLETVSYAAAPVIGDETGIKASLENGYGYEIDAEDLSSSPVYEVAVPDSSGSSASEVITHYNYVSGCCVEHTAGVLSTKAVLSDGYGITAGSAVSIRRADIEKIQTQTEGCSGGLSLWSETANKQAETVSLNNNSDYNELDKTEVTVGLDDSGKATYTIVDAGSTSGTKNFTWDNLCAMTGGKLLLIPTEDVTIKPVTLNPLAEENNNGILVNITRNEQEQYIYPMSSFTLKTTGKTVVFELPELTVNKLP